MRSIGPSNGHLEALHRTFWRICGPWYSKYVLSFDSGGVMVSTEHPIAQYLNDLWFFDIQEYKWHQIEFGVNDRRPLVRQIVLRRRSSLLNLVNV
jgi:hypothetical protein